MTKTWDFLRGVVPDFQLPDETFSEMKPQAAAPAAEREARPNESPAPGPERSKGLRFATSTHSVVCVQSHTHPVNRNYTLHV